MEEGKNSISPSKKGARPLPTFVDANIYLGGEFDIVKGAVQYVGGQIYVKLNMWLNELDVIRLRRDVQTSMTHIWGSYTDNFSIWCCRRGKTLTKGRLKVQSEEDIKLLVDSRDTYNRVNVYVTIEGPLCISPTPAQLGYKPKPNPKPSRKVKPEPSSPRRSSRLLNLEKEVMYVGENTQEGPSTVACNPATPSTKASYTATPSTAPPKKPPAKSPPKPPAKSPAKSPPKSPAKFKLPPKSPAKSIPPPKSAAKSKPATKPKVRGDKNKKALEFDEDWDGEGEWSDESKVSDTDVEFDIGEEDRGSDDVSDVELTSERAEEITKGLSVIVGKKGKGKRKAILGKKGKGKLHKRVSVEEEHGQFDSVQEHEYDSEDLESLHGSDEDVDKYPTFNPTIDFSKKIDLSLGLKFRSVRILRKALQHHAIENHYDYYFLHNGNKRVTVYCKHKCHCEWDVKVSRLRECHCEEANKCPFKLMATKLKFDDKLQIKSLNLTHTCGWRDANAKVSAEYLAEKYVEHWRCDPNFSLKSFRGLVQRDLGVEIKYCKAWLARARAKLMIYGDSSEEYAMVYDYAEALLKYNQGSTVVVKCEVVDNELHVFQRMYVCLYGCKQGFIKGCRPLIGVDGCHLKGAHPGMILVAVSKDGNNCIFPIAWAIVEVENKESWTWFLSFLVEDINMPEGAGLTLMSDRQKGLLDAIGTCLPKAEVRYCVRHIWANFKLHFSGQCFKEHFWHAARTYNKKTFANELECIKLLSEEAHEYLIAIPAKHWARHAFLTTSRSNMLLNNLCETFNNVLRQARDKPVITCLEWIRRYVIKRTFDKLQSVDKVGGKFMPYVSKVFEWIKKEAQDCMLLQCSPNEWEVTHKDSTHVTHLGAKTCTCGKWALTGIPCPHAYACIVKRRESLDNYVDHYYTKEMYVLAYNNPIRPMPGIKQWEPSTCTTKPLTPAIRTMPGRPSTKKRKKEAGEVDGEGKFVKRVRKPNCCTNCGQPGHNILKCKNPPKNNSTDKGGRPFSDTTWANNQRKKKEARTQALKAALEGSASQSNQAPLPSQASQSSNAPQSSEASQLAQASQACQTPLPSRRAKLNVNSKKKNS